MASKIYVVDGRKFKSQSEYQMALVDQKLIQRMREVSDGYSPAEKRKLIEKIRKGAYPFKTKLGLDFAEELEKSLIGADKKKSEAQNNKKQNFAGDRRNEARAREKQEQMDQLVRLEMKKAEKRRKYLRISLTVVALVSLTWFLIYIYYDYKTVKNQERVNQMKENYQESDKNSPASAKNDKPLFTLDAPLEEKEVLEEYKNLYSENKRLIGWIKIDDTNIDYPVMQTNDNSYYLDHNFGEEYDKNGAIFMDKDCDVSKPSTNFIIYGHHMASGRMFGKLGLYESETYYKEHSKIQFDTIYEKGTYEIMYVFRSRVYSAEDVVFRYYQFIDVGSEQEFESYMEEMEMNSLYNTGVTAKYGDHLLTLTTCDYHEKNGRFVVVAKRISE